MVDFSLQIKPKKKIVISQYTKFLIQMFKIPNNIQLKNNLNLIPQSFTSSKKQLFSKITKKNNI